MAANHIFENAWRLPETRKQDGPSVHVTSGKWGNWIDMMNRIIESWAIAPNELESVSGRIAFAQTSVFGRVGRAMMAPLYTKLHMGNYYSSISLTAKTSMSWRTLALAHMKHRRETPKPPMAERIVYTDDAGKTQIISASRLTPETFASADRMGSVRASETCHRWRRALEKTCYIRS